MYKKEVQGWAKHLDFYDIGYSVSSACVCTGILRTPWMEKSVYRLELPQNSCCTDVFGYYCPGIF